MKFLSGINFVLFGLFINMANAVSSANMKPYTPCDSSGGWGLECAYNRIFLLENISQTAGEVVAIENFIPMSKMTEGVLLKLKTGKEIINVHLGPRWFVDNQEFQIKISDNIDIKGSKVLFLGAPAIIASEVVSRDRVLVLRDHQG